MKVTIKTCEAKISNSGNAYKVGTLNNGSNDVEYLVFTKFKDYDAIQEGAEIECLLTPTKEGDKFFINDPKVVGGGFGGGVAKAQDRKEKMIEKAQDRKNDAIAYFNAINNAVNILGQYHPDKWDVDSYRLEIKKWHSWLLDGWKQYEASDVSDKRQPF